MEHIEIDNPSKCCGCKSCENICPKKAIIMLENEEGFLYPSVDENKCINCGLCKKICPWINEIDRKLYLDNPICYAAKIKEKEIQKKSTSGGAFATFALRVLEQGGIVIGSEMDSNHQVHHIIIDNKNDLKKIMGSKYVYSDLEDIFIKIKEQLNNKKQVLFSGVPCQISALLNFLQKTYDNLITVEVICHGTPSQRLFDKYVDYLEEKNSAKLKDFQFRSKKAANWGTFKALASFVDANRNSQSKFTKKINADFDPYYWSFLNCKNYRESCYECKFANPERNADITLGDFWGIEHIKPDMVDYDGVSVVIINSNKGVKLFETIKENLECDIVDYNEIQQNNGQLKEPSKRPIERDIWYNNFHSKDFIKKIKIQRSFKSYIKIIFPQKLKFRFKKIISKNRSNVNDI